MASAEDQEERLLLQLFDSFWFEFGIFASKPITSSTPQAVGPSIPPQEREKPKLSRTPTLMVRSFSEEFLSSKNEEFLSSEKSDSPKYVLVPKLQPILSGKELKEFSDEEAAPPPRIEEGNKEDRRTRRRRKNGNSNSKSLSELEFEELKGFMDLGFVFPDEVKNSSLISILPGLQRMVAKNEVQVRVFGNETAVSRPYLSEAWGAQEPKRKIADPLMNWRIPDFGNEGELKDHLKFWAHSVASAVR